MRLLVLGASGGCGRWIVKHAQERGHHVRTIVREETQFEISGEVDVIRGLVLNKDVLKEGLDGCDAVLSSLGIQRKNPINPWSSLSSPDDLTKRVAEILVELMPCFNIKRFVGISAAGVRESFQKVNPIIKWMISNSNMNASYKDLAQMESILQESSLNWMAVRPVTLKDGSSTGQVKVTEYYGLTDQIRRADVAKWMLDRVEQDKIFLNRTPMIKSP